VGIGRDNGACKLTNVHEGGPAHKAGLSAGDIIVALDGLRVTGHPSNLETLLSRYKVGDKVTVHVFRRDELMEFALTLQGDRVPGITLSPAAGARKAGAPARPSEIER
jgi:predicted metalloprotease with PDZ domain